MVKEARKKVAFVSSFLPRKCGIATFTSDLIHNVSVASRRAFEPLGVAMRSGDSELEYGDTIKFEIRQNVKNDYICAADYINFSHVDVVSIQHEFGLFGGDAGSYLNLLLSRLNAPIITTVHTVINEPEPAYYKSMMDLCNASYKIITMNERGVDMLRDVYGISGEKVELIPHGIPDLPFVDNYYYKHKFGIEGRRTILTFGLLNKNKGIEVMLQAMPAIVEAEPSVLYVILGMTHPSVLRYDGESYRFGLQQMVKELGIQKNVIFHNRFVDDKELSNFLCAADIYVTPYLNPEQLTSGTLSFAVGTGKAVVSTPYWAAIELLSKGRGKLVQFGDSKELATSIIEILKDDKLFYSLRRRAYEYGRSRTWPKIGQNYWKLFNAKKLPVHITAKARPVTVESASRMEVPEPSLIHLKRLTDDTGLYQHAKFTVPNREHGYCTDDNARALIVMVKYYAQYPDPQVLELFDKYLSFTMHSQTRDGLIRNFMTFDRKWLDGEPAGDTLGRALWAFGTIMANPPSSSYIPITKDCFDRSVGHVEKEQPRGLAYSLIGMSNYLKQFPGASDIKRNMIMAADKLAKLYEKNSAEKWLWFEDELTYDNAILPYAMFVAGLSFADEKYLDIAEKTCEFLIENTFINGHFSFVGCKGWYERGGKRAEFDQQPIEVPSTVMMLRTAYEVTNNTKYLALQRKAFDWFLGENDLGIAVYDFRTKGCHDGLMQGGINLNQGAESTLSFLLSLLTIVESYTVVDGIAEEEKSPQKKIFLRQKKLVDQLSLEFTPIKDVSSKNVTSKKIEKPV